MANKTVKPVPDGYHTINAYLTVKGADKAIEFYKKAFGAQELYRMPAPGGKVMHAELKFGDSTFMLADEMPEMAGSCRSPQTLKGTPVQLFVYVPDADATFRQATAAGAKVETPLADMFWGDRFGVLADPFGHRWDIATHKEDLTPQEVSKRAEAFFKQPAGKA